VNAILGDLKQVLAIEGRASMGGDVDRAYRLAGHGIEGVQLVAGRKPDVLTVKRHAINPVGIGKRTIFAEDFGC
jgi:hypothetical protein